MPGFWTTTPAGHTVHVNGDPNMPEETRLALCQLMDAYHKQDDARRKSFEHVWGQGNHTGIDKEEAYWWFSAGCDWPGEQSKKRIEWLEKRLRQEIEAHMPTTTTDFVPPGRDEGRMDFDE